MNINNYIENILIKLGKDNTPTLVAISVAVAKGIFRPIFTMMDKEQDEDTKKYTAIREALTEAVAIPVYWSSGKAAVWIANAMIKPKDMSKDLYQQILHKDKNPQNVRTSLIRREAFKLRSNLSMLGVFLSALLIIPAVCSVTIKPIMKMIKKPEQQENTPAQINVQPDIANDKKIVPVTVLNNSSNAVYSPLAAVNSFSGHGMRIGGL